VISHSNLRLGTQARDRLDQARDPGAKGALAALETFYYALNNRDPRTLAAVIADDDLVQVNNPLGGMLRGGRAIIDLYLNKIFQGSVRIEVEFSDFIQYTGGAHALFAGRERGTYRVNDADPQPLEIRTSRYFRYDTNAGRWIQYHHHGSIDNPQALAAYQHAVEGQQPATTWPGASRSHLAEDH
jgi:ketosteroid isomerase-like protein